MLRGHGADDDIGAVGPDSLEIANAAEVDEMPRRRQPKLHDRDQAVAAGEWPGVVAEIGEERDGVLYGFRAVVGECARYHGFLPGHSAAQVSA